MLRRWAAGTAVLALLLGLAAAPYTHVHQAFEAPGDEHHSHAPTLIHSHVSSHSPERDAGDAGAHVGEASAERIWSINSFVFQQAAAPHAPTSALFVSAVAFAEVTSVWLGAHRTHPEAHAPPPTSSSGLRAPPVSRL